MDDLLKINRDINNFINNILSNQVLLKLLYYNDNPLEQTDLMDGTILLDNNIFTTAKISDIVTQTKSFLIHYPNDFHYSDSAGYKNNSFFISGNLVFDIIIHNSLWYINSNRDERWIFIGNELNNMLHNQCIKSIGRIMFEKFYKVSVGDNDYSCYRFIYSITHKNTGNKNI